MYWCICIALVLMKQKGFMSKNQDTKYKEAKIFNNPHIPIQVPQTLENNVAFNLIKNKTLSSPRAVLELKCVVRTM